MSSTTTTVTIKTLKATAEATKTIKTTTRTVARGEVTEDEATDIAAGSMRMSTRTVTETAMTEMPTTTTTFSDSARLADRYFYLLDITHSESDKVRMEENLVEHVKDTISILESKSGEKIRWMYIGKTYIDVREGQTFNRLNHETWKEKGIDDRWNSTRTRKGHKDQYYAKDGMVVLCAFTQDDLPTGSRRSHEYLALAMEQRLIHHFQIFDTNELPVVVNPSADQGSTSIHTNTSKLNECENARAAPPPQSAHRASVVYMTFAYREEGQEGGRQEGQGGGRQEGQGGGRQEQRGGRQEGQGGGRQEQGQERGQEGGQEDDEENNEENNEENEDSKENGEDEENNEDNRDEEENAPLKESVSETSSAKKSAKEISTSLPMSAFAENYPHFSSTPISSPKESISSPTTSALPSKENIPPLSTSSPLSTVRKDLLPALEETLELLQTTQ